MRNLELDCDARFRSRFHGCDWADDGRLLANVPPPGRNLVGPTGQKAFLDNLDSDMSEPIAMAERSTRRMRRKYPFKIHENIELFVKNLGASFRCNPLKIKYLVGFMVRRGVASLLQAIFGT